MMRKQPKRWSVRFELAPEEEDHVRLHEYLNDLYDSGNASQWIRQTLIAALPAKSSSPAAVQPHPAERNYHMRSPSIGPTNPPLHSPPYRPKSSPARSNPDEPDDPTYEDIDNA